MLFPLKNVTMNIGRSVTMAFDSSAHRYLRQSTFTSVLLLLAIVAAGTTAAAVDAKNKQQQQQQQQRQQQKKNGGNTTLIVATIRGSNVVEPSTTSSTTTTDATDVVVVGRYVSNLDGQCMRCLCHASTVCNVTFGCSQGYCGPYYLYRDYWNDAGRLVLRDDDADRDRAFVDCAEDLSCAQKVVVSYMAKWARDCNEDGVTDCDDFARTHFNGREDCSGIEKTNFWKRYETCRPGNSKGTFNI